MKLDEALFEYDGDFTVDPAEPDDEQAAIEGAVLSDLENRIANLEIGEDELVLDMRTPIIGITDAGFNKLHIIKRTPDWYKIWNTDDDGNIANETNFSSFDNTLYWATMASQGESTGVEESLKEDLDTMVEIAPGEPTEDQVSNGYQNELISLINGEWETIQDYNGLISMLQDVEEYSEFIPVIEAIVKDEHNHIGNLQTILDKLNPGSNKEIDAGHEEAKEILTNEN